MIGEWLNPLLAWLGLGMIPFLLIVFIVVYVLKG